MKKGNLSSLVTLSLISAYLVLPLFLTFIYSIFKQWNGLWPKDFTLNFYISLFRSGDFLAPLGRTILISFFPVAICIVVMLLAVYVTSIVKPQWDKIMQFVCTVPYALQGVILAVGVLSLYSGMPSPFSNRIVMLSGTYCVLILPYMYRGVQNSLMAVDAKNLMAAAQLLGLSRFNAYLRVVVPNITRGIKVSMLLSVALLFGDFVVVNTIGGSYYTTAQTYLLHHLMRQSGQAASALTFILFLVTFVISAGAFSGSGKQGE